MEIGFDQLLAVILASGMLSGVVSYFVSWMVSHDAIDTERQIQERKRLRESKAVWERTHIPDEPDVSYRSR